MHVEDREDRDAGGDGKGNMTLDIDPEADDTGEGRTPGFAGEKGRPAGTGEAGTGMKAQPFDLVVEAALFSSGKPMSMAEISEHTGMPVDSVRKGLKELVKAYARRESALEVGKSGDRYCLQLRETFRPYSINLARMEVPTRFLKTLAIIAYEQPIAQKRLVETIGEKVLVHIKWLTGMDFIERKRKGRSFYLTTTRKFVSYFGLSKDDPESIRLHLAAKLGLKPSKRVLDAHGQTTQPDPSEQAQAGAPGAVENAATPGEKK